MSGKSSRMSTFLRLHREALVCLGLMIAALAVYWQVRTHEFINFDDDEYVTENLNVY